jgi:RimJ/RimL family protein N-acetyltransferase
MGGLQHSTIGIGDRLTVGYVIAPEAWGRGYATEVAIASVAHAFGILGPPPVRVRPVDQCGVSPSAGEGWVISAL